MIVGMVLRAFSLISLLALLGPPAVRGASDGNIDRATIKGLKAVNVVADLLPPELESQGLTQNMLREQIEERLRSAHITPDRNAPEFLGLRISSLKTRKGPYSLYISLGLYQPVMLNRNHDVKTSTQTWETGTVLVVEPKVLVRSISNTVDQLLDQFVDAYHSVNRE